MNNNDFTFWFALMAVLNTTIGLSNFDKNWEQEERQERIEAKLGIILGKLFEDE